MAHGDAAKPCRVRAHWALSSRRRTRAGRRWRSARQGQSTSGAPFRRGRRQACEDRSPGRGDSSAYGRIAGIGGPPSPKRDPARTEGALRRSRGPGEGPNRRQEPRKSSDAFAVEASECSATRPDRSPDRDSRSGDPPDHRSRPKPRGSLRHPDQHSRHIQHHSLRPADRNAGARRNGSRTGRQPRRPGPDRPTVRALDRPLIHSRRSRRCPPGPLHASPRRRALQPGHEGQIRAPRRNRKASESRLDRDHAKTPSFGRIITAIGSNEEAVRLSGIAVPRYILSGPRDLRRARWARGHHLDEPHRGRLGAGQRRTGTRRDRGRRHRRREPHGRPRRRDQYAARRAGASSPTS